MMFYRKEKSVGRAPSPWKGEGRGGDQVLKMINPHPALRADLPFARGGERSTEKRR
jgi:hypothetical protein